MSHQDLTYALTFPENWSILTLTEASIAQDAESITKNFISVMPSMLKEREALTQRVHAALSAALSAGTREVGNLLLPTDDGLLSASFMLQIIPNIIPENGESVYEAIVRTMSEPDEDRPTDPDFSLINIDGVGKAVQMSGRELMYSNFQGLSTNQFVVRTFVPLESLVLLITFFTPNLEVEMVMAEMFDLITKTLRINHEEK
ncbi:hypothetical protein ACFQY8_03235 [Alloscardovia venturai]|uniref:Uncharacterized protein n=1 Tax=Alloscardovia venturai TaxID=1769421 RepID=A0ABW2Y4T2_9BIFI